MSALKIYLGLLYRFHVIVPPIQTLVSSGFEPKLLKYRQRDDSKNWPNWLSYAVLTFIYLYNTKVVTCFFFIYLVQYVTYVLVAEYLLFNDCW